MSTSCPFNFRLFRRVSLAGHVKYSKNSESLHLSFLNFFFSLSHSLKELLGFDKILAPIESILSFFPLCVACIWGTNSNMQTSSFCNCLSQEKLMEWWEPWGEKSCLNVAFVICKNNQELSKLMKLILLPRIMKIHTFNGKTNKVLWHIRAQAAIDVVSFMLPPNFLPSQLMCFR